MSIVIIGGHTRSVGKTSVVAGLIAALRDLHWTALKITQYGHGVCSANGAACDCATADHSWAVTEERDRSGDSDTSRFLVAGADHSWWVRTQQGRLAEAAPLLAGEPPLDPLREAPPYDAGRAAAWSTALPGAGFFSLGEGGRGATALGLDLAFLAGTVIAYQQHNVPVALISFTVAAALYSGGREAVREEAGRLNDRWLDARREAWLARSSEPRLMAVAFDLKF